MLRGQILELPTLETAAVLADRLGSLAPWFYRFPFANGYATDPPDAVTEAVHDERAALILPALDQRFAERWPSVSCLDVACHEGWFAAQVAARGARRVVGVDLRPEHVERAGVIASAASLPNLAYEQGDLFTLDPGRLGAFDLTLFLGVLYHVDNPVQALRIARSLTTELCVIETQVARGSVELSCLWGSGTPRSGPAIAVVPSDDRHVQGGRGVVLVPTMDALLHILDVVGFSDVVVAAPRPGAFAQFADGDRVVVFASV